MAAARVPELEPGGADRAAEALIDLATGLSSGFETGPVSALAGGLAGGGRY
jgi:hypothetical protein